MSTHFEHSPEVLVVGAGPSGLALSVALARRGIRVEVIDRARKPSDGLRAVALQAGTLELLQRSLGRDAVDRIVTEGKPLSEIVAHHRERRIVLNLATLPTPYPFILSLEQSRLEQLLTEELTRAGVQVRRGHELKAFNRENDSVTCELSGPGGEHIRTGSRYLVGCDGPHSMVRSSLGVAFAGHPDPHEYFVADIDLAGDELSPHAHHLFFSTSGIAAIYPLPGRRNHRALLVPNRPSGTSANFFDMAARLLPVSIRVGNAHAVGHLHFHDRISPKLRLGHVLLAGDAAHVCNPAGGQGMNLGLHDVSCLAPILAGALRHNSLTHLDEYEKHRLRAAREVRSLTRKLMAACDLSDSFFFRHLLWPAFEWNGPKRRLLMQISQLSLAQRAELV